MPPDDSNFFEHVKRHLENRDLYNEFLKVVNLFTQEYIDMATLVKESRHFLGDSELYKQFKDILGWTIGENDNKTLLRSNPRLVAIAKFLQNECPCSGRDEMCRSVLNDDWVCHPTWTSEDSGFVATKKNIYEEALHRSEEERHEYDFHIEAITRTIAILEPITIKIAQMNVDDRTSFKLKPNLGGAWKAIHQRVIKKIYGREAGLEVIHSMQDTPALAIPVVLGRLKQKEEEWKRAQREWNKVWREVDARNFAKSLDHQAITFKVADKRAITTKALMDFVMDLSVVQDALKLTFSFMDRTHTQVSFADRRKLEASLRSFIPLFFTLDPVAYNSAFSLPDSNLLESEGSESDSASVNADLEMPIPLSIPIPLAYLPPLPRSTAGLHHRIAKAGWLRRKVKSEDEGAERVVPSDVAATVAGADEEELVPEVAPVDLADGIREARQNPRRYIFFTNTTFYVLVRLLLVLTSRLSEFKDLSAKIAAQDPKLVDQIPDLVGR
ncbi:hypothetical protein FA13DRAFT_1797244 [Coprinellus micaceus]|uniref:Histone deacetylase interacting domain-containing protein n=1 Tax=Coprinellus micaceus TaxID=71717 RepID=A0A4Y7SSA7_COPMI|nr:hypothetical protein FA13DRAFT_1797244 [Coprinellus micaceus]